MRGPTPCALVLIAIVLSASAFSGDDAVPETAEADYSDTVSLVEVPPTERAAASVSKKTKAAPKREARPKPSVVGATATLVATGSSLVYKCDCTGKDDPRTGKGGKCDKLAHNQAWCFVSKDCPNKVASAMIGTEFAWWSAEPCKKLFRPAPPKGTMKENLPPKGDSSDERQTATGHYYLGAGRRRTGDGFGKYNPHAHLTKAEEWAKLTPVEKKVVQAQLLKTHPELKDAWGTKSDEQKRDAIHDLHKALGDDDEDDDHFETPTEAKKKIRKMQEGHAKQAGARIVEQAEKERVAKVLAENKAKAAARELITKEKAKKAKEREQELKQKATPSPTPVPTPRPTPLPTFSDTLKIRESLYYPSRLVAKNGRVKLALQDDGNLVIYSDGNMVWKSNTGGHSDLKTRLTLQDDGNLVYYAGNSQNAVLWKSDTVNGDKLVMQNDCNLVLYDAGGGSSWKSGNGC